MRTYHEQTVTNLPTDDGPTRLLGAILLRAVTDAENGSREAQSWLTEFVGYRPGEGRKDEKRIAYRNL